MYQILIAKLSLLLISWVFSSFLFISFIVYHLWWNKDVYIKRISDQSQHWRPLRELSCQVRQFCVSKGHTSVQLVTAIRQLIWAGKWSSVARQESSSYSTPVALPRRYTPAQSLQLSAEQPTQIELNQATRAPCACVRVMAADVRYVSLWYHDSSYTVFIHLFTRYSSTNLDMTTFISTTSKMSSTVLHTAMLIHILSHSVDTVVPPFKITRGRWNCHGSIGHL